MTLWFEMQLLDELPMVWGTLILVYTLAEVSKPANSKNYYLMAGLLLYGTIVTAVYLTIKVPVFHQVAYGFLVALTFIMSLRLAWNEYFEFWLFTAAALSYLTGFIVWNVDNAYCAQLSSARRTLPSFVVPFTQFHALWHCFAGYGAYISILYCVQARLTHLKKKCGMKLGPVGLEIDLDDRRRSKTK